MKTKQTKDTVQLIYKWENLKTYSIDYIFDLISKTPKEKWFLDRDNTRIKLERVKFFRKHGTECIRCGTKGTHFSLRKDNGGNNHVDLYGYTDEGLEVLINRDHIVPKSRGGVDNYSNMQPMCMVCNSIKGNYLEEELKNEPGYDTDIIK
jgi:5-methylcytosine-specific restriction endonuclease McrA